MILKTYSSNLIVLLIKSDSHMAASIPKVFSTSNVLLEVVSQPLTPGVAITFLKLLPSTSSLYVLALPFSSMCMMARETDGTPWP